MQSHNDNTKLRKLARKYEAQAESNLESGRPYCSLLLFRLAIKQYEKMNLKSYDDNFEIHELKMKLADVKYNMGSIPSALKLYSECIDYGFHNERQYLYSVQRLLGHCYAQLASNKLGEGNLAESEVMFQTAISHLTKITHEIFECNKVANDYLQYGRCLLRHSKYELAVKQVVKGLNICQNLIKKSWKPNRIDLLTKANCEYEAGLNFRGLAKPQKAKKYFNYAIATCNQIEPKDPAVLKIIADSSYELAAVYNLDIKLAYAHFKKIEQLAKTAIKYYLQLPSVGSFRKCYLLLREGVAETQLSSLYQLAETIFTASSNFRVTNRLEFLYKFALNNMYQRPDGKRLAAELIQLMEIILHVFPIVNPELQQYLAISANMETFQDKLDNLKFKLETLSLVIPGELGSKEFLLSKFQDQQQKIQEFKTAHTEVIAQIESLKTQLQAANDEFEALNEATERPKKLLKIN